MGTRQVSQPDCWSWCPARVQSIAAVRRPHGTSSDAFDGDLALFAAEEGDAGGVAGAARPCRSPSMPTVA